MNSPLQREPVDLVSFQLQTNYFLFITTFKVLYFLKASEWRNQWATDMKKQISICRVGPKEWPCNLHGKLQESIALKPLHLTIELFYSSAFGSHHKQRAFCRIKTSEVFIRWYFEIKLSQNISNNGLSASILCTVEPFHSNGKRWDFQRGHKLYVHLSLVPLKIWAQIKNRIDPHHHQSDVLSKLYSWTVLHM